MARTALVLLIASTALAGCAASPAPVEVAQVTTSEPLEVLPAGIGAAEIRTDVLATARDRFGEAAVQKALTAPAYIMTKRFVGMAPPPPPGAGPNWRAPTMAALLIRQDGQWLFATAEGWRPAKREVAAEIDRRIAEARLWDEPAYTLPCPDYGANLVVLKVPDKEEIVRHSLCSSAAADLALAALNA